MDFNQVRYFLALADTLNFTRAAERCDVSQSALTQGIKRLEVELGGELVRREGRYTELTELGHGLRNSFEQIDNTRKLVNMTARAIISGEDAELNIGIMCTIGPQVLSKMLSGFNREYPMISVVLHDVAPSAVEELLLTRGLDAIFCVQPGPSHPRLRYIDLYDEPMVVAFPPGHEFESYDVVSLSQLATQHYIERLHCEFRQTVAELSRDQGMELFVTFSSEREDWIQCLVREGAGVSLIPRYSVIKPELNFRPVAEPPLSRKVQLAITNNATLPPALEKFITEIAAFQWEQTS